MRPSFDLTGVVCLHSHDIDPMMCCFGDLRMAPMCKPNIEMYTTAVCPYCIAAKRLLSERGLSWTELRIDRDPAARMTMLNRSMGARTVPQIFINGQLLGGFEQLAAADHDGSLQSLLEMDAA